MGIGISPNYINEEGNARCACCRRKVNVGDTQLCVCCDKFVCNACSRYIATYAGYVCRKCKP